MVCLLRVSAQRSCQQVRCLSRQISNSRTPAIGFVQLHPGFTPGQVEAWQSLTGDHNPIHHSLQAAVNAGLEQPVLPGMLCASLFPAIIGSKFPGILYLTQTLKFRQSALVGEALEAEVTVAKVKGRYISFDTICRRYQDKAVIVDGAAMACL